MQGGAGVCTGIDNIVNRRHNRKSTFIAAFCVFAQFVLLFCGKQGSSLDCKQSLRAGKEG